MAFTRDQTGFTQREEDFFDSVYNVPLENGGQTEFSVEFSPTLTARGPGIFGRTPNAVANGDPHFLRWNQNKRDSFHGECDLVFIKSEVVDVHIRTTIESFYSYIEEVAVRVGDDIVEFQNKKVILNGEVVDVGTIPLMLGSGGRILKTSEDKHEYLIYASDFTYVTVGNHHKLMKVEISGSTIDLAESKGIMGEYGTGKMVGRFGQMVDDFVGFGFEWQVHPEDDPQLFKTARMPQLPYEKCRIPTQSRPSRRLGARDIDLFEKASAACARHGGGKDLCIDDVMATGDLDVAEFW